MKNIKEMRRITAIVVIFGLLAMMFYPIMEIASTAAGGAEEVCIPDPGLEELIREAIDKPYGPIYVEDLEGLTILDAGLNAPGRGIADLTGLEYCTDLESLHLWSNEITDIAPLSQLVNLESLNLGGNEITDLSPLSQLVNLEELDLRWNEITDLSPLSHLVNLWSLNLSSNEITDIAPLVLNSGLSEGDMVYLTGNPLSRKSIKVYIPQLEERGVIVKW